jgi:hypothetical protein
VWGCGRFEADLLGRALHHGDLLFEAPDHRTYRPNDLQTGCGAVGPVWARLRLCCAWSGGGNVHAGCEFPAGVGLGAAVPWGCGCGFCVLRPVLGCIDARESVGIACERLVDPLGGRCVCWL